MDKNKIKSIWDVLVPQDTTDNEMRVSPPKERKKIDYNPDPEVRPLANPNPILGNTSNTVQCNTNVGTTQCVKPAPAASTSSSEKVNIGHPPVDSSNPPNIGASAGKTKHEEFKSIEDKANTNDGETKSSSGKKSSSWHVVAAIVLLIIIITATYFINEKIKGNRKKRTEKHDDDFLDSFLDSTAGNITRFCGIALGLLIVTLALLYSTSLLTQAIKSVDKSS